MIDDEDCVMLEDLLVAETDDKVWIYRRKRPSEEEEDCQIICESFKRDTIRPMELCPCCSAFAQSFTLCDWCDTRVCERCIVYDVDSNWKDCKQCERLEKMARKNSFKPLINVYATALMQS